ncbi:unnamed protein product [Candidula unifasciata]|uniref:Spliceosome-associated protein CWC27 homolog n=1 Tax=Candidula unifasciata TaxID=100452 RepID=A0A8S3ZFA7_9EUPU|nr:unnamed protein product [Candidula unifasciata]
MSNIYILEPPTKGKVLLVTSVGDIDIELWSKEAPKACRNFVQLCMEEYYNGTTFHRVVKDFIVQGGDPTGTGTGGESIYGAPFKDEFHTRLRFVRRGLVAMANAGPHDNGSQFFFTMNQTPELQNKHTIFGKVGGDTVYNMLKLQEVEVDDNERPLYPHKIIRTEILSNPFDDIIPRVIKKVKKEKEEDKKVRSKSKATKNFSLLSFGEEAEEDEEQTFKASKKFSGKSKSSHDLTDDPDLSSVPVVEVESADTDKSSVKRKGQDDVESGTSDVTTEEVRKKLKKEDPPVALPKQEIPEEPAVDEVKKSKSEDIKKEVKRLQKEIKESKKRASAKNKEPAAEDQKSENIENPVKEEKKADGEPDFLEAFKLERQKYKTLKKQQNKKGLTREAQTLAILEKFQSKLSSVKHVAVEYSDSETEDKNDDDVEEDASDMSWMRHKLQFEADNKKKVLDPNVTDSDRYEIHDPRNPMTQRRREASEKKAKQK